MRRRLKLYGLIFIGVGLPAAAQRTIQDRDGQVSVASRLDQRELRLKVLALRDQHVDVADHAVRVAPI